jgi:teichuronic acid biosynthesis glycosyltransferase TuaG
MDDKLVSVIVPAYKAAAFIGRTVESVIAQTYPHWEMLIADDCSPDDTRTVVAQWAQREPRVKLIALERNGGPAAARNAALQRASGRWIAFLDSDDMWLPGKLERCLAHAQAHRAALVFTGYRRASFWAIPRSPRPPCSSIAPLQAMCAWSACSTTTSCAGCPSSSAGTSPTGWTKT